MVVIYDTPENSGISGYSLIAEVDPNDVAIQVTPGNIDKNYGDTPASIDTVLSWDAPIDGADSYNVHFGPYVTGDPNIGKPELVETGNTSGSYTPTLEFNQSYVWRVDAVRGGETFIGDYFYFDVEGDPLILTQPGSPAAGLGGSATFYLEAILSDNYVWYSSEDAVADTPEDDVLLQSGPNSELVIEDVQEADAIYYYAVLTNSIPDSSAVTSDVVGLKIGELEIYLPFDGDPNDVSGNGWDGIPTGTVTYEAGIMGQAVRTDNSNVVIDGTVVIDETEVDMLNFYSEGLTVSCWVKVNTPYVLTGGWYTVVAKNSRNGWAVRDRNGYSGGGPAISVSPVGIQSGANKLDADNADFGGDNWHQVVMTYDPSKREMALYADGLFVQSKPVVPNPTLDNGPIKVGSQPNDGGVLPGLIDELKIYSYPLNGSEIADGYVAVTGNTVCIEEILGDINDDCKVNMEDFLAVVGDWLDSTNPESETPSEQASRVVSWQFDDTEGMVATDSSGNGIDGTLGAGFTTGQWIADGGRTGQTGDGALYMDGSDDTSVIATVADPNGLATGNIFQGTSPWTMNLWVKFVDSSTMNNIGGFGYNGWLDPSVDSDRYFASWNGGLEFELGQTGLFPSNGFGSEWRMITSTYDGATCVVYFNGQQVSQTAVTLVDTTVNEVNLNTARRVLWSGADATVPMDAYVDDFSIWDETFTAAQVAGMYSNSFISCDGALDADMNGDCVVDLVDFSIVAGSWLECNLAPSSLCD